MASIRMHRDVYGFKRKHFGLTIRQIAWMAAAVPCAAAGLFVFVEVLALPAYLASVPAILAGAPPLACAFVKFYDIPVERAALRHRKLSRRGNVILAVTSPGLGLERGELTRGFRKKQKKAGYERAPEAAGRR